MTAPGYLAGIHLVKTFTHEDVRVTLPPLDGAGPHHLIFVGPNGSGKTVTLDGVAYALRNLAKQQSLLQSADQLHDAHRQHAGHSPFERAASKKLAKLNSKFPIQVQVTGADDAPEPLVVHVPAQRDFVGTPVAGPAAQDLPALKDSAQLDQQSFVQYLVNQRTEQAYAREDGDDARADRIAAWFASLDRNLSELLGAKVELLFERQPKFGFHLSVEGVTSPFDHLPAGWNAVLDVFSKLLMRYEAHREDPVTSTRAAILLIDEPDVHLHPRLQLTILPTLSTMFPRLQIVAATHSPIVAASLANATVYDLAHERVVLNAYGGPPESLLLRAFDLAETRPPEVAKLLHAAEAEIDTGNWTGARQHLDAFAQTVGEDDPDVLRLRSMLALSESLTAED